MTISKYENETTEDLKNQVTELRTKLENLLKNGLQENALKVLKTIQAIENELNNRK